MKKIISLALALMMVLGLVVTANADATIVSPENGHTYEVYQIFTGEISDGKFSTPRWGEDSIPTGDGVIGEHIPEAVENEILAVNSETNANVVLAVLEKYVNLDGNPTYMVEDGQSVTVEPGYYLIKDVDNALQGENADAYTVYIATVAGGQNLTIAPKADKPTLKKEILHNDGGWDVVGDNQIGDTVQFRIISTVPHYTANYDEYHYVIHDTMDAGLTSHVSSVNDVTILVDDAVNEQLDHKYYTVSANGNTFTISINVKQAVADSVMNAEDELYVYYSATLNKNALVYDKKQENTAYLEYSNNPKDGTEKVKTPDKKVYEWTYKMDLDKYDGATIKDNDREYLGGAKFVLSTVGTLKNLELNDSGVPISTTDLIPLVKEGDSYRIATTDDTDTTFVIEAGHATIKGLDDHHPYYFYEVDAPEGYNRLREPVKVVITATYTNDGATSTPSIAVDETGSSNTMVAEVANHEGSAMPETGGIGTTIFYFVGTVLALGAGVMLITKKRMNNI